MRELGRQSSILLFQLLLKTEIKRQSMVTGQWTLGTQMEPVFTEYFGLKTLPDGPKKCLPHC